MVKIDSEQASVVVRALSVNDTRRLATRECNRALGTGRWRLTQETISPCLLSLGGRVRLYEGRFSASRVNL